MGSHISLEQLSQVAMIVVIVVLAGVCLRKICKAASREATDAEESRLFRDHKASDFAASRSPKGPNSP